MNVESFNLDHRAVKAPYVRVADTKTLPGGDVLTKFDIRFAQPNVAHLEMPTVHSLEHLMAEHMRSHTDAVIADRLGMNIRTARVHIAKLAATLGSGSRAQLGYLIGQSGILDRAE